VSGAIDEALAEPTLAAAFLRSARANADRVALSHYGAAKTVTYGELLERARRVAGGLEQLGVRRGDRVALLLPTCPEFHVVDIGALLLGAVAFSLYPTAPVTQLLEPIDNAEPVVLVADASRADACREIMAARPGIRRLVMIDGAEGDELSLDDLEASCPEAFDVTAAASRVQPDDLLTLIYTSGTTGAPKGVTFRHGGMMATLRSVHFRTPAAEGGRTACFLPMAHIAERMLGHYAGFVYGMSMMSITDTKQLLDGLRAARPTRFFGVPRMWEKVLAEARAAVDRLPEPQAAAVRRAMAEGLTWVQAHGNGQQPTAEARSQRAAQLAALAPLREAVGFEDAEWLCSAGAPCSVGILEGLHAIGLEINESYGLSEATIITLNPTGRIRIGTCGVLQRHLEAKIAADGELLVRGASVTPGYLKDPERTREVLEDDGFLHTGDIGVFDDEGYLRIVGRKKELIISSTGKNMSPSNIESAIKGDNPVIDQVVCIGEARPYNVALIVPSADYLAALAARGDVPDSPFAELARHPKVLEEISAAVERGNPELSRTEQIKTYAVITEAWAPGGDELTDNGKLRRQPISEKYEAIIDALYESGRRPAGGGVATTPNEQRAIAPPAMS
jgi:long-chain acyl-CoA synthetase